MWDRVSQVVLIIFGLLVLVVLTLGLAISCREGPPSPEEGTSTAVALTLTAAAGSLTPVLPPPGSTATATLPPGVTPGATASPTLVGGATASATLLPGVTPSATPIGGATPVDPGATATATLLPGVTPSATPIGGATPGDPTPTPMATATAPSGSGLSPGATVQHVVVRGEWLLQIARCYGASYNAVRAANRLGNPDYILPGAVITVPNIGSDGRIIGPPCVQAYTVQAGDTWQSLAARYGTTAAILQLANPGGLVAGRQIWVPRV